MRRYNYILLSAATIFAMVGCEMSDLDATPNEVEQTITFTPSVESTRATETDEKALLEYAKFNVATFLTDSDNTYYYSDVVSYNGSVWSSGATRYWPADYNLNLHAYSPIEEFIVVDNSVDYTDYLLIYTCPVGIDDQVDLLVETLKDQSYDQGVIELEFKHALSSIKFNVEINSESNITLETITLNYVNIENKRSYNLSTGAWDDKDPIYFSLTDGLTTQIEVNENQTSTQGSVEFTKIDNCLMIIPQAISSSESDPHYISVQITYTLDSADGVSTPVKTGIMPLPAPDSNNFYKMGYLYTYNIVINGETITFDEISIEDQESPVDAYGNINLDLITTPISYSDYEEAINASSASATTIEADAGEHYYYATAVRVAQLLDDGVRDFVVVGSFGAEGSDGKLGYYGSVSSPFYIAANSLGMMPDYYIDDSEDYENMVFSEPNDGYLFSIDLRGVYGFPEFGSTHDVDYTSSATLNPSAPILTSGIFKDLPLLDEVIFPQGLLAIGDHAFQNCMSLRSVDLAEVIHIEEGAFVDCIGLVEVVGGELTRVHDNGFDSCKSLETIDLSLVTEIDELAFANCESLTNVNLSSLVTIGEHAFDGCYNLTLQENTSIPAFTSVAAFAFSKCYLLGANGITIDLNETESVGDFAFNECHEIKLSSGALEKMTTIGNYTFTNCQHIGTDNEFSMPIIESIGISAFEGCTLLNIIEGLENLTEISISAFQGCESLTGYSKSLTDESLKLLNLSNVSKVGDFGLSETGLTNVAFNSSKLTTVGNYALNNTLKLTTITGLEGVTSVGNYAFAGCAALKSISLPLLEDGGCGGNFISDCSSLEYVSLPSVTTDRIDWDEVIEDGTVVSKTTYITTMLNGANSTLQYLDLRSLEDEIPNGTFYGSALVEVNIDSVPSIGYGAFQSCTSLESISLSSATSIGDYAFQHCSSLEELIMPKVDGEFGDWGYFATNTNLKRVDLSSVETLDVGTFADHTTIESINLASATTVGNGAFQGCIGLKKLNLSSLESTPVDWTFQYIPDGQCELWLSPTLYNDISGNVWNGITWKAIYSSDDSSNEFTLY